MNLVIRGKNIEVPENARDYITKKTNRFDRHLKTITEIKVEVSEEKTRSKENQYVVEMTINCQGTYIRGEKRGPDIFSAADAATDVVEHQIDRYRGHLQNRKSQPASQKETVEVDETFDKESTPIKVKRFPIRPMSPEEAIDQMELLGHDFFVFFSRNNDQINVVYRRKDGAYGLIEPEFD
ncbi:MAG: ribosome-associated translation inhibitor RaiA [Dehalococcoidia bacterium]|nr:ribosome-associated translation inhibitor RaiA [Dehalococcoidia bacterium]